MFSSLQNKLFLLGYFIILMHVWDATLIDGLVLLVDDDMAWTTRTQINGNLLLSLCSIHELVETNTQVHINQSINQ